MTVPGGSRTRLSNSHTETVDASVLIVDIKEESVGFALVTSLTSYQILNQHNNSAIQYQSTNILVFFYEFFF